MRIFVSTREHGYTYRAENWFYENGGLRLLWPDIYESSGWKPLRAWATDVSALFIPNEQIIHAQEIGT